jgi:CheY-like chemotaxis protein
MKSIKSILLVEDNPLDQELTIEGLSEHKIANKIVTVSDGVEAMEYLKYEGKFANREKGNPAIILLDIKMPRMDGIEVLQAIKKDDKLKCIPIIMLTSSREEPDLKKCYELGVNAYVVKPVEFDEFFDVVKNTTIFWLIINEQPPEL